MLKVQGVAVMRPEDGGDLSVGETGKLLRASFALHIDEVKVDDVAAIPQVSDVLSIGRPEGIGGVTDIHELIHRERGGEGGGVGHPRNWAERRNQQESREKRHVHPLRV
jgi:hypothetical protein